MRTAKNRAAKARESKLHARAANGYPVRRKKNLKLHQLEIRLLLDLLLEDKKATRQVNRDERERQAAILKVQTY